ncbi:SDR family NAD(P)-dependent oxidoreductase [Agrococcus baldri]|uniref:Dehydrogenase/reductase n=1 Tax=Agrococcus baldri TaxID=153730 RepID=A0AA87UQ70_9MICO|nr:SDR family NAD(P)-dependent oxidoreductase [Agrococcus baldri]GEK78691.1 putative dehydrogenase/reductase [Agrococcus baldri]
MTVIVMTGGSSGFGAMAAARLAAAGSTLLVGARSRPIPAGEPIPLELARLASVHAFAAVVGRRLDAARPGGAPIDVLVLNAGIVLPDAAQRTDDGFETAFAVNHLAPFLLLQLLRPRLAESAVVVLTTSGTHDPATRAGLTPPRHADAARLAHPQLDPGCEQHSREAGEHAYTAAKLCVVLTALALSRRFEAEGAGRRAIAFEPGQVFGTGLARQMPPAMRLAWRVLGSRTLGWLPRTISSTRNSPAAAGRALASLAESGASHGASGYAALRRGRLSWPQPSELAWDAETGEALWRDSAALLGITAPA